MDKGKTLTVIGLMSGTSFDGVDAAIVKTDGVTIQSLGKTYESSYGDSLRKKIRNLINRKNSIRLLLDVEDEITREHARVVKDLLKKANLKSSDIDLIGFHGQAIYHNPTKKKTLIIGNPSLLSELTKINVVADFRSKDIARGGQGAPLVPFYHKALCEHLPKPVAVLNIGGVANVTYVGENSVMAFDVGPGCALIDDFVYDREKKQFDDGGKIARSGIPNEGLLELFMKNKFFSKAPPKSLDRNNFKSIMKKIDDLDTEDGAATLTYLTARSIYNAQKFFPQPPKKWIVCGGGSKNIFLIDILKKQYNFEIMNLEDFKVFDVASINPDFVEAQAFGFLAVRSYYNLPLSAPYTTGVSSEVSGGAFYRL